MSTMHIWCLDAWKRNVDTTKVGYKAGIRMHFERGIPYEVRAFLIQFTRWMRKEYLFPLRVNVYVKQARRIKAMDGDLVVGTIWRPTNYEDFPYIRLAVGDYQELVCERGNEGAQCAILHTFAHELTHYFQHINNVKLTRIGEERQATMYGRYILEEYLDSLTRTGGG